MTVGIEGMHCDACVRRVRMALEKIAGAQVDRVIVGSASVTGVAAQAVLEAIRKAGYEPKPDTQH